MCNLEICHWSKWGGEISETFILVKFRMEITKWDHVPAFLVPSIFGDMSGPCIFFEHFSFRVSGFRLVSHNIFPKKCCGSPHCPPIIPPRSSPKSTTSSKETPVVRVHMLLLFSFYSVWHFGSLLRIVRQKRTKLFSEKFLR